MTRKRIGISALFVCMACFCVFPATVSAEGGIEQAKTIEQYIDASSPDLDIEEVTVDKKTGETGEGSFEETFGTDFPGENADIKEAIEDTGEYQVTGETKTSIEAVSKFATKRIVVMGKLDSLYGASSAICYDGETLLTYDTEEAAKEGYEKLVSERGERNVFIDLPLVTSAKGWGTAFMNIDKKMQALSGNSTVTVAVVDTGINKNHEIFSGKTISPKSYNLVAGNDNYADDNMHGTMTAGIIAESTPNNVQIMALKAMNDKGVGSSVTYAQAIKYASDNGADIINCSLGGKIDGGSAYMDRHMSQAEQAGAIIVSASGNDGADMDTTTYYPCESPYSLCIASIGKTKNHSSFSNYGANVDFCAPGESIKVAYYQGGYATSSGTSFSCPYITACISLLKMETPALTKAQAVQKLLNISEDLGTSGRDVYFGYGMPKFPEGGGQTSSSSSSSTTATTTTTTTTTTTSQTGSSTSTPPGKTDIAKYPVTLAYSTTVYTGKALQPSVTVSGLSRGVDYTVSYSDNINAGTATVTLAGIGNYTGKRTLHFMITPRKVSPVVKLSPEVFYHDGKAKHPAVSVYIDGSRAGEALYTVSGITGASSIGTYRVSVTMKGNYRGEGSATYQIKAKPLQKPGTPDLTSVKWKKVKKKYKPKASWGKVNGAAGYQVQINSVKKKKKGVKFSQTVTAGGNTYTFGKAYTKNKKKYSSVSVRVRAYNKAGFGEWSAWKKVR